MALTLASACGGGSATDSELAGAGLSAPLLIPGGSSAPLDDGTIGRNRRGQAAALSNTGLCTEDSFKISVPTGFDLQHENFTCDSNLLRNFLSLGCPDVQSALVLFEDHIWTMCWSIQLIGEESLTPGTGNPDYEYACTVNFPTPEGAALSDISEPQAPQVDVACTRNGSITPNTGSQQQTQ